MGEAPLDIVIANELKSSVDIEDNVSLEYETDDDDSDASVESNQMVHEPIEVRTRSGRVVKPAQRYGW